MKTSCFFQHYLSSSFIKEIRASLALALPLVLTQLLDGLLGLVDTLVAGQLNTVSIASLAAANGLFWAVVCIAGGLLSGLDTYIPRCVGAGKTRLSYRYIIQSIWLVVCATVLTLAFVVLFAFGYHLSNADTQVLEGMMSYLLLVLPSTPCIFLMMVLQKYWQSYNYVTFFTLLMLGMNLLNLYLNLALVHGWFGFELGVKGIALSTTCCRFLACVSVLFFSVYLWRGHGVCFGGLRLHTLTLSRRYMRQLLSIGLPSAGHLAADVIAFNVLIFFAAQTGVIPLAAHQIMFMITCMAVMIPIGFSSSACIRVGQCLGADDPLTAVRAARINMMVCMVIMIFVSVFLWCAPAVILSGFTTDDRLIQMTIPLVKLCAVLMIADSAQMVLIGVLRAYGEVSRVFRLTVVAHYCIGLPVGLVACYFFELGILGLWLGVGAALTSCWAFNMYLLVDVRRHKFSCCREIGTFGRVFNFK